jgi:hypothetical protein
MRPRLGIEVAASSDRAWHELIALSCWPHWGPTVRSARLDDGSGRLSAGATGAVQTALGPWLPFRVESWRDDGPLRSWSWRVAGVPAAEHAVISRGPSRCRVEMSVPWWAVAYLGVVKVALMRIRRRAERVAGN